MTALDRLREAVEFCDRYSFQGRMMRADDLREYYAALKLPDPEQNTPGVIHRDPHSTESEAALRAMPRTGTQRGRVLDAIWQAHLDGRDGLTDEEIGALPGINDTAHRTRRNELVKYGWVEKTESVRPTKSEAESIVWGPSNRALLELGA